MGMAGLVVGRGIFGGSGSRRIFENLEKNFVRKLQKLHYFSLFFPKKLKTLRYIFARMDEKQLAGEK